MRWARGQGRLIDFVWINVSGMQGVGVLLPYAYVNMEIIDFLLPRIKQKMYENIKITFDCVKLSLPFHENNHPWSMLWPRPICPGYDDRDHDKRIILEVDVMDKINE